MPKQSISISSFYLGGNKAGLPGSHGQGRDRLGAPFLLLDSQPCGSCVDVWGRCHGDCVSLASIGVHGLQAAV